MQVLTQIPETAQFDVAVIGAGGAGMAAALFAALHGAKVLLIERTSHVGGTTAWSAGTTWIPGSHHAASVNPDDTLAEAARYLDNAVGERSPPALRQAFLNQGAKAVAWIEEKTQVKFRPYPKHPDYISDLGGSTLNGRALEPLPFDARVLGELAQLVRPPIPEFTVLGGMMVDRTDINHLLGMTDSMASLRHSARILLRHLGDRLQYPRGMRWVMGNALVGRLLYSLSQQAGVSLALDTKVDGFGKGAHGIESLTLQKGGQRCTVKVSAGVVLASGGFNRNPALRQSMLPGADIQWCPAAPGHTGAAHALAQGLGARYGSGGLSHAFWAPVSIRKRPDGSQAVFPHFVMDRAKPGMITLNQTGERFVNESTSYHLFGLAMQDKASVPAYLICDAHALRQYGIGMARPGGKGLEPFLADGYLTEGASLAELASKLGMPVATAQASIERFNASAAQGVDRDFGRGETAYQRNLGDPASATSNPCLGAITQGPFYAVRLYPGDIGAATGFVTDAHARVLDTGGQAIGGLYAIGNDMQSIMGGVYPAPGITIGPGLVFAYLAADHLRSRCTNLG